MTLAPAVSFEIADAIATTTHDRPECHDALELEGAHDPALRPRNRPTMPVGNR